MSSDADVIRLERWAGPWEADDPDAGFKQEVAEYTRLNPLTTLQGLSEYSGIPVGALARYVLVKWSAAGSEGLLEIGPTMVERLWACVAEAERHGSDADRLAAYHALKDLLAWLRAGLT
jgi:hypothetical protein